jgi:hypothetical protein
MKKGTRVGAILSAKGDTIHLFGYGVYVGDEIPPDEGGSSMTTMLHEDGMTNPKIVLDGGDVVWGCECWWGPEAEIQREVSKHKNVVQARVAEARRIGTS